VIETPPTEIVGIIQAVVAMDLTIPIQTSPMDIGVQPTTPASTQDTSGNNNNGENRERRAEEIPLTTASRELPLARQPIFDLNGGGVAGQNMVCK
jgi:hypothetical protein